MINTATAFTKAWANRGEGPANALMMKASAAIPTTIGTK